MKPFEARRPGMAGNSTLAGMAVITAAVLAVLVLALSLSCSGGGGRYRDGWYSAIAADWDAHGWKEFVTICVNNGVITTVEYNAMNAGGFVKSWDADYMAVMKARSGTYPQEYTRYYAGQLLQGQGAVTPVLEAAGSVWLDEDSLPYIDALTGATDSWFTFRLLAAAVLEKARAGDTSIALVEMENEAGAAGE